MYVGSERAGQVLVVVGDNDNPFYRPRVRNCTRKHRVMVVTCISTALCMRFALRSSAMTCSLPALGSGCTRADSWLPSPHRSDILCVSL